MSSPRVGRLAAVLAAAATLAAVAAVAAVALVVVTPPADASAEPPQPAPTRGLVTGRVLDHQGRPVAGAVVVGIRFSDLARPVDQSRERIVSATTGRDGRFRLPQLRERYLVRVCDPHPDSADCSDDPAVTRFARTYVGPDGTSYSWLQQTRMFTPIAAGRRLGEVRVRRAAVLTGVFRGAQFRPVALARLDGSRAATAYPDGRGRYRFEVAPGRYRVVADYYAYVQTPALEPGHRSPVLHLRAGRVRHHSFATRAAGVVGGRVLHDGEPVPYQPITVVDSHGRVALDLASDERGRWSVRALRDGRYTVAIPHARSPYVAQRHEIDVRRGRPVRLDLHLQDGGSVTVGVDDPTGASADLELRNAAGRVVNTFKGRTTQEDGGAVTFPGIAPGRYTLVARRVDGPHDPVLDWTTRTVVVRGEGDHVDLGRLTLDRAPVTMAGTAPPGSQLKFTPLPQDAWLRPTFRRSGESFGTTIGWTTQVGPSGRFAVEGVVPGEYAVTVSSQYRNHGSGTTVRGRLATTFTTLTIGATPPTPHFTTPAGREVVARLRFAGSRRPLVAPVGLDVAGSGDRSWLIPTVSEPQRHGSGVRVRRLHPGPATARLVVEDELYRRAESVADVFTGSSAIAEPGTPFWLALADGPRRFHVARRGVTDLGRVDVILRGGRSVPAGATRA